MKTEKEYEPFGVEWKDEVKKLDKNTLITMWRKSLLELRDLKVKAYNLEEKLDAFEMADKIIIGDYAERIEKLKFEHERDIQDYNEQVDNMREALRFLISNEHIEQDNYLAAIERFKKQFAI